MTRYENEKMIGERILFNSSNIECENCSFDGGESPVKESDNIKALSLENFCRYPFWYSKNIEVKNSLFHDDSRAAFWYTDHILFSNTLHKAPKAFRRCRDIKIENSNFINSNELLWHCFDVSIMNSHIEGDYLLMNSSNVKIENLELNGKYSFDGCCNLEISNSLLHTKDAFWNAKNVYVKNSFIEAEYIGWNAENIVFENCTLKSHQGFCYIQGLKLINCKIIDSDLIFEYSNVSGNIEVENCSIKNPTIANLLIKGEYELILDEKDPKIDISKITLEKIN